MYSPRVRTIILKQCNVSMPRVDWVQIESRTRWRNVGLTVDVDALAAREHCPMPLSNAPRLRGQKLGPVIGSVLYPKAVVVDETRHEPSPPLEEDFSEKYMSILKCQRGGLCARTEKRVTGGGTLGCRPCFDVPSLAMSFSALSFKVGSLSNSLS